MKKQKRYEELTFADNYMFCKILSIKKELCKALIELLLDIKVKDISYPGYEKVLEGLGNNHGIRLDVYVDDDCGTVYDLEMQTTMPKNLPKRSRYYQDMIDLDLLEKGKNYNELNKTYIVFICLEDPFDKGLARYRFRNACAEDNTLLLGDESEKVFINARGSREEISEELASFLDMLIGATPVKNSLADNIEKAVKEAKDYYRWKEEYKSVINWVDEEKERAREEGLAEGKKEALASFVRRLLIKNFSDGEIMDMTECSAELLEHVKKELQEGK